MVSLIEYLLNDPNINDTFKEAIFNSLIKKNENSEGLWKS